MQWRKYYTAWCRCVTAAKGTFSVSEGDIRTALWSKFLLISVTKFIRIGTTVQSRYTSIFYWALYGNLTSKQWWLSQYICKLVSLFRDAGTEPHEALSTFKQPNLHINKERFAAHFLFIFWFFNILTLLLTITQHYIISLTEITLNKLQIYKKSVFYTYVLFCQQISFLAGLCTFLHECKLHNADLSDTGKLQAQVCLLRHKTDVGTKVMKLHQIQAVGQSLYE